MQLKISGEGIKPGTMSCKSIGEILTLYEDLVMSYHKHEKGEKGDICIESIKEGSMVLNCLTLNPLILESYKNLIEILLERNLELLPKKTRKRIEKIIDFGKKKKCEVGIKLGEHEAVIDENLIRGNLINGDTEIYGIIIRVGGKEPKVQIEQITGERSTFEVNEEVAKEMGKILYKEIAIEGIAEWDSETLDLVNFKFTSYRVVEDFMEVFENLRETARGCFDDIGDVNEYVNKIRRGE